MATPPTKTLVNIDFDGLKKSFTDFLKANSAFKDYNFEGSNLNVLLDVLALNTTYTQFYLNMALSESFLDSAILRTSVVSHAKELNYLPRSIRSAKAVIRLEIIPNNSPETIFVPRGTAFMTAIDGANYTFVTDRNFVIQQIAGSYTIDSLPIFEGRYITERFLVDNTIPNQKFVLSNDNVDTTSLDVAIFETAESTVSTQLMFANTLLGLDGNSPIFTLQNTNGKYELLFGDGTIGIAVQNQNLVQVTYRVCSGDRSNGAYQFTNVAPIGGYSNIRLTTVSAASGGDQEEDIESIRTYAPRYYQAQNRAVTESDYETLIKNRFPEIETISVFGGETLNPPQFGRVIISVDTISRTGLSNSLKTEIIDFIKSHNTLTIEPIVVSPEFTFLEIVSHVLYDTTRVDQTLSAITEEILSGIRQFRDSNLNRFRTVFISSRLQTIIDNSNLAILGNVTQVRLQKRPQLSFDKLNTMYLDFQSPGKTLQSSPFVLSGNRVYISDDGNGIAHIYTSSSNATPSIVVSNIGSVNYLTGLITLTKFQVDSIDMPFRVYWTPETPEVTVRENVILELDLADVAITLAPA